MHFAILVRRLASLALLAWLVTVVGCSSGPVLYEVTGTVKFDDGSVPQGELAVIRFEPVGEGPSASGAINPQDGSYMLETAEGDSGAFPGKYKVTFTIQDGSIAQQSLVPEKYTDKEQTPEEATITESGDNVFHFTLEKK